MPQVTLDNVASVALDADTSTTLPITVGNDPNRVSVACVHYRSQALAAITAMRFEGVNLTAVGDRNSGGSSALYVYGGWAANGNAPPSGVGNLVVDFDAAPTDGYLSILTFARASAVTGFVSAETTEPTEPSLVVTSAIDEMIVDFLTNFAGLTIGSNGVGRTQRYNATSGRIHACSTCEGAASVTMDWTGAGGPGDVCLLAGVRVTAAAGVTLPWQPRHTNLSGPSGAIMLPGGMTPPSAVS